MELKELVALGLIFMSVPVCSALLTYWRRGRDFAFFVLVFGAMITERLDINFVSREWYRGTTRGFEISFLDILSVSLLVAMWLRPRKGESRFFWPASLGPLLAYLAYCFASVLFSDPQLFGMFELLKVARGILLFVTVANYVRSEKQLRVFLWSFIAAVLYQGFVAVKMRYLGGVHRVYGTLEHPNSLSLYMCMAVPVLYAAAMSKLPKWQQRFALLAVLIGMVAVLLTISRTGVVTLGLVLFGIVAACFSFRLTVRNILITGGVICALVLGVAYSWKTMMARFEGASIEDEKEKGRGEYIRLAKLIVADRFFGVGLGNWSYWVSNKYGPMDGSPFKPYIGTSDAPDMTNPKGLETAQAPPAHNLGALTAGELGWPGVMVFAVVWLRWFQMGVSFLWKRRSDPMLRIGAGLFFAVCAAFFQSLTEWEYRQTPIMFIFHILLGVLAALHWRQKHPLPEAEPARG